MFEMRQQLKLQYRSVNPLLELMVMWKILMSRATQSAQVMERKASDSKRRFVSYSKCFYPSLDSSFHSPSPT
jgi:hypothetical protein